MRTHRFGRKLKLPSTIAIKHQIRRLMLEDWVKEAELRARTEAVGEQTCAGVYSLGAQIA
jgi:hypothetical protein